MDQQQENRGLTRKEREKSTRQQEILKAARELFIKKGYHDTTLEEIARHAEFGKGTIYNYFTNKDELFFGIISQLIEEIAQLAQSAIHDAVGGAREKCLAYAEVMISHARDNADLFHLIIRELHHLNDGDSYESHLQGFHERTKSFWGILAEPIAADIRAGRLRPYNEMELAALFEGMVRFYCVRHIEQMDIIEYKNIHEVASLITSVFFDGISESKSKG